MFKALIQALLDFKAQKEIPPTKADPTIDLMEIFSYKQFSSGAYGLLYLEISTNKSSKYNFDSGGMKPLTDAKKEELLKMCAEFMEDIEPQLET